MAEGAALWVDHLLPAVDYRQWVLSFEGLLAVRLGYDPALLAKVAERFARALMQDLRYSVKTHHGLRSVELLHAGVLTVVQRFRSDLGLYVHLHCLVTEGAFEEAGAEVRFLPAQTPTLERLVAVLAHVHKAIAAVDEEEDLDLDPALAVCVQLGLANLHAVPLPKPVTPRPLTVTAFGMHLHAATIVDGRERTQLERVCRYLLRPPFAHDAVKELPDGRVRVLFKAPWRNGVAHVNLTPHTFLARLCALVPPPGFHQIRFYGVFANRHHLRARILPPSLVPSPAEQLALHFTNAGREGSAKSPDSSPRPRRLGWAKLLARVFAIDVTVCQTCGGRMRIVEVVTDPEHIARILPTARAPPRPGRSHPPGQLLLFP